MGRHASRAAGATALGARLFRLWWDNLWLRVGVGVVVTVALALSVRQALDPPENLDTAQPVQQPAVAIEPSAAVELYIPSIDLVAGFEEGSCRVKDGAINPDTLDQACTYTAADKPYSLPGSDATDIVVIAGHTGAGISAVFDNLYDGSANRHTLAVGDALYLKTVNSGSRWLVYRATDLHDPEKSGLSQDAAVWGTGATPGRLLTISCIQPANPLESAVRNAVVGWQYEGVVDEAAAGSGQEGGGAQAPTVSPFPYPGHEPRLEGS